MNPENYHINLIIDAEIYDDWKGLLHLNHYRVFGRGSQVSESVRKATSWAFKQALKNPELLRDIMGEKL